MLLKNYKIKNENKEKKTEKLDNKGEKKYKDQYSNMSSNENKKDMNNIDETNNLENDEKNYTNNVNSDNLQNNSQEKQIQMINSGLTKKNNEFHKLSDVINFYYDDITELENRFTELKKRRKEMKIIYIQKYLNLISLKSDFTTEENIKRRRLKNSLFENGKEMTDIKNKLDKLKLDIISKLTDVKVI